MSARRISNGSAIAMIGCAVALDGVQALLTGTLLLLPLAWFFTLVGIIGFFLWLGRLDVFKLARKGGGTKLLMGVTTSIAELIPFVNALPAWTAGIVAIIIKERMLEAKEKGEEVDPKKMVAMARLARMKVAQNQHLETAREIRELKELERHPEA